MKNLAWPSDVNAFASFRRILNLLPILGDELTLRLFGEMCELSDDKALKDFLSLLRAEVAGRQRK